MASWLWGNNKTTFTHHNEPISLRQKNGKTQSLLSICELATPPCKLNPLLFNGHLQTGWTSAGGFDIPVFYKRHIFEAERPEFAGTFAVDFVVPPNNDENKSLPPRTTYFTEEQFTGYCHKENETPLLIALHGLAGGSDELYLRSGIKPLINEGWDVCVVNARGCARSKITSGIMYTARATWDVRQVVAWARRTWPKRKLFGIGFSLGGNILTNYIAEEGENCLLKAAVVCSNPWNLDVCSTLLARTWVGLNVYSRSMQQGMMEVFNSNIDQISKNPRVNVEKVRNTRYLFEFDRELQGPVWGYPSEGAYYRDASSCDAIYGVRIPFFAVHARDDPITAQEAIPWSEFKSNPYAVLCTTASGGHLGWFESGGGRWFVKPCVNFLKKMAEDIEVEKPKTEAVLNGPKAEDIQIAAKPPPFLPMRRRMRMPQDQ